MLEPSIEIVGVYRVPVTEELLKEQFDILYEGLILSKEEEDEALQRCLDQLNSIVLIEIIVRNRDSRFRLDDISQADPELPRDSWQAPYDEAYLSLDGERVLSRDSEPEGYDELRVVFFLHFYNPEQPLLTSYGVLRCPTVQNMPERLQRLVSYEPVD